MARRGTFDPEYVRPGIFDPEYSRKGAFDPDYLEAAGGGTTFTQDVAGTLTSSGGLVKQTSANKTGTLTSAGSLVKQCGRFLAATMASAGALVNQAQKNGLAGTLSSSAVLSATKVAMMAVAGTLTSAGSLVKEMAKAVAGTLTDSGTVVKQDQKVLAGSLPTAGTVVKQTGKTLAGTLSSSGALAATKVALLSIAGTLTSAGNLVKQCGKFLAGTLTDAGTVAKQTGHGGAGTLGSSGTVSKQTGKTVAGTLTTAGAMAAVKAALKDLAGTLTSAGSVTKQTSANRAGTLTTAGTVSKHTATSKAGTLGAAGTVSKQVFLPLLPGNGGTLGLSGSLSKQTTRHLTGRLAFDIFSHVGNLGQDISGGRLVDVAGTLHYVGQAFGYKSTDDGRTWTEHATFPANSGLLGATAVAFGGEAWVIGGLDVGGSVGGGIRPEVWKTSDQATWTAGPTLPVGLYAPAAAVFDGFVWISGGMTDLGDGSRKVFKSNGGAWAEVGTDALPIDLQGHCMVAHGSHVYAYGGQSLVGLAGALTLQVYRAGTNGVWAAVGTDTLPYGVYAAGGVSVGGKLWLISGDDFAGGGGQKVQQSADDGLTWTEYLTDALPGGCTDGGIVAREPSFIWAAGGFNIFGRVVMLDLRDQLVKQTSKGLVATLAPSGAITKAVRVSVAGVLGMIGATGRLIPRALAGTLSMSSSLFRSIGGPAVFAMLTAARTTPAGVLAARTAKAAARWSRTIRDMLRASRGN